MIAFLCLLVGFFVGVCFGALAYQKGCENQIANEHMITIVDKTYHLTEVGAQSEK